MDFMIGIEQELLFFMNPSVIEKNKVDKYIHYFLMDSLNILVIF